MINVSIGDELLIYYDPRLYESYRDDIDWLDHNCKKRKVKVVEITADYIKTLAPCKTYYIKIYCNYFFRIIRNISKPNFVIRNYN